MALPTVVQFKGRVTALNAGVDLTITPVASEKHSSIGGITSIVVATTQQARLGQEFVVKLELTQQ